MSFSGCVPAVFWRQVVGGRGERCIRKCRLWEREQLVGFDAGVTYQSVNGQDFGVIKGRKGN